MPAAKPNTTFLVEPNPKLKLLRYLNCACGTPLAVQIREMGYNIRDHVGQRVRVRHCVGAYQLPDGLPAGAEVILEDFQPGYWMVNYNGGRFRVAMPCVGDGGRLPQRKRIHPGCKPRVPCESPRSFFGV